MSVLTQSENLKQIMEMIKNNNFCCRGINLNNLNYKDIDSFKNSLAKEFAIKAKGYNENEWNEITQIAFESLFHWGVSNKYSFTQSQCDILEKYFGIFEMATIPEPNHDTNENERFYNFKKNYELYYYSDDEDERIYPLIRT